MLISSLMCRTENKKMAYRDSGGSRGAGGPGSLSFVDPVEVRRLGPKTKKFWNHPPPLPSQGVDPLPHPYMKVWTRNWKITFYYQSESHAASETNVLYTKYVPASEVWYDIRFGLFFFFLHGYAWMRLYIDVWVWGWRFKSSSCSECHYLSWSVGFRHQQ